MRRKLAVALVVGLALSLAALAVPKPAAAGHGGLIHGTKRWIIADGTFGPNRLTAYANVSVEESESGASVRFRHSTECFKNGAHTTCNHALNNAELEWKNCIAETGCFGGQYGSYGLRDFGTFASGTWYGLAVGGWHSDTHKSYISHSRNVRVRFTEGSIDWLTPSVHVCSLYTEPDDTGDYDIGTACDSA